MARHKHNIKSVTVYRHTDIPLNKPTPSLSKYKVKLYCGQGGSFWAGLDHATPPSCDLLPS